MGEGFKLDQSIANKAIKRLESVTLYSGEYNGQKLHLLDWQREFVSQLLGCVNEATGLRQYREAFLFIPSKNGKSLLASALCLLFLMDTTEPGGCCISAAPTKEQAAICYNNIKQFIKKDPYLAKILTCNDNLKRIVNSKTQTYYRAIANDSDTAEGLDASFILVDELHAFRDRKLFDTLKHRQGARRQPLLITITTAGPYPDMENCCYQLYDYAKKVRDGIIKDDAFLPVIYEATEQDDIWEEATWHKANPSLGTIRKIEDMRRKASEAKNSASLEAAFRRYAFNQWIAADERWLNLDTWNNCLGNVTLESLRGKDVYLGLDVASNLDLTSLAVYSVESDGKRKAFSYFFAPKETAWNKEKTDRVPYRVWADQGHIELTTGETTDYESIRSRIQDIADVCNVKAIGIDKWNAAQFANELQASGLNVSFVRQNAYTMSPALRELEKMLQSKRIELPSNPVLSWCAANACIEEGGSGDIRLMKQKGPNRIDGIVALASAVLVGMAEESKGDKEEIVTDGSIVWI